MNNPLIEMAEEHDFIVSLKGRHPAMKAHNPEYSRNARILRAAEAVILQMQALRDDIRERQIFWPAEVDFAIESLEAYEAACKEQP